MKVTALETYFLSAPLPQVVRTSTHAISRVSEVIVKLTTDAGLVGIGEAHGPFLFQQGPDGLRAIYELLFSNDGGIPLEHCVLADDGRACALEYNVVRWGKTELTPQAGVAVYVRGESGKLVAARIYDDVDPPI